MSDTLNESALMALLVEDDQRSLELRKGMLDEVGFATLPARSEEEALREFVASPGVDVVITDIRLRTDRPRDRSGVDLARKIKEINSDIPIVGYSAAFSENELNYTERSLFTSYYARGGSGPQQIVAHFSDWKALATEFRKKRVEDTVRRLEHFRVKYRQPDPEFSVLRFLVPTRQLQTADEILSVEDVLRTAGFRLRIIGRNEQRPTLDEGFSTVTAQILVWLRDVEGVTVAEIYGFPELYSFGDRESEAIRNLLLLMDGFHRDLIDGEGPMEGRAASLAEYLKGVFGE